MPPLQRTWNTNRDKLIQESALLSKELVDSIGDLSKIHHVHPQIGQKLAAREGLQSPACEMESSHRKTDVNKYARTLNF